MTSTVQPLPNILAHNEGLIPFVSYTLFCWYGCLPPLSNDGFICLTSLISTALVVPVSKQYVLPSALLNGPVPPLPVLT
jgi:hypothetical protein